MESADTALTRSSDLLSRQRSCLLVVDVQERLLPVISNRVEIVNSIQLLIAAAATLNVPAVISEQYPQGLGHTVPEITQAMPQVARFEKRQFSAAAGFRAWQSGAADEECSLDAGRVDARQILLCGIEAHVCVLQTALDLLSEGLQVYVAADAVGSFRTHDCAAALQRLRDAGCCVVTSESAVFEWCETSAAAEFKEISRLVRLHRSPGQP